MLLFGTQREGARIGRRAGAQQRVVGRLDAGRQHQRIVVDGGAAPNVLARGLIVCYGAGVALPAAGGPAERLLGPRVLRPPLPPHPPPLPLLLRTFSPPSLP